MALPTTANPNVRAVASWTERPLTEFGDTDTVIYHFDCVCLNSDYTKLNRGAKLSSAFNAGLIESQYTDGLARWIGDSNFVYSDGGYIKFIRKFARVPKSFSDYSTTLFTFPPQFTTKTVPITVITDDDGNIIETLGSQTVQERSRPSRSESVNVRLDYQFSTNPQSFDIKTEYTFSVVEDINGFFNVEYTGDQDVVESTKVTRWRGDIYQAVTSYTL